MRQAVRRGHGGGDGGREEKKVMNGIDRGVNDKQSEADREEGAGNASFFFARVEAFSCLQSDLLGSM